MSIVFAVVALVLALVAFRIYRGTKHLKRAAFIREYEHAAAVNCATDFGSSSSDNSSDGFGDLGFTTRDAGGD